MNLLDAIMHCVNCGDVVTFEKTAFGVLNVRCRTHVENDLLTISNNLLYEELSEKSLAELLYTQEQELFIEGLKLRNALQGRR